MSTTSPDMAHESLAVNPFRRNRAQRLDFEEVAQQFVRTRATVEFERPNEVHAVIGGRGSGKSMLLRYCDAQTRAYLTKFELRQQLAWRDARTEYLSRLPFLGTYVFVDRIAFGAIQNAHLESEQRTPLFGHYLNLYWAEAVLQGLRRLTELAVIDLEVILPRLRAICIEEFGAGATDTSLANMTESAAVARRSIEHFIDNAMGMQASRFEAPLRRLGAPIERIAEVLVESDIFAGKPLVLMLDEYENFSDEQQRAVNTLIRQCRPPLMFKLATRQYGWRTQEILGGEGIHGEELRRNVDFKELLLEQDLFARGGGRRGRSEFSKLVRGIATNRLSRHQYFGGRGLTDWSKFLDATNVTEEAREAVESSRSLARQLRNDLTQAVKAVAVEDAAGQAAAIDSLYRSDDPLRTVFHTALVRQLRTSRQLSNLVRDINASPDPHKSDYEDVKEVLLLRLISGLKKRRKRYAGIDTLVDLSSGIVSNFLELCFQVYGLALAAGSGYLIEGRRIPAAVQTLAVETAADASLDEGGAIWPPARTFVEVLGTLFREVHLVSDGLQQPTSHFTVNYYGLSDSTRTTLEWCVKLALLHERRAPRGARLRRGQMRLNDYVLSRMLLPRYQLPYRIGHPIHLETHDLEKIAAVKNPSEISELVASMVSRLRKTIPEQGELPITDTRNGRVSRKE